MEPGAGLIPLLVVAGSIAFICLFGLGFVALFILILRAISAQDQKKKALAQAAAASWLSTSGRIIKSRVEMMGTKTVVYHPKIMYEYSVAGSSYQGEQIEVGVSPILDSESAYAVIDRYPVGAEVTVFYNPENPAEAALER